MFGWVGGDKGCLGGLEEIRDVWVGWRRMVKV